jgi:FKBP-type peptidyl-prolyl cis-trans isomerase
LLSFLPATLWDMLSLLGILLLAASLCEAQAGKTITTKSGLQYEVVAEGHGQPAKTGASVRVHETTTLKDGTLIYSTRRNGKPLKFLLGGNQVIAGVDEGVRGMRVGERRKLVVPPSLSKRSSYPANTPPEATLYYDIELVEIIPEKP